MVEEYIQYPYDKEFISITSQAFSILSSISGYDPKYITFIVKTSNILQIIFSSLQLADNELKGAKEEHREEIFRAQHSIIFTFSNILIIEEFQEKLLELIEMNSKVIFRMLGGGS